MKQSLRPDYFDSLYEAKPDPWDFATSTYEQEKYAATLAALPQPRFESAFEVGCSIGILTRMLAGRCTRLLSVDVAQAALAQAEHHCADLDNVQFARMQVPEEWPQDRFDLTVFSEVLYYLSPDDIARTAEQAMRTRAAGGVFLLVHWTGPTNYPCSADEAVGLFMRACALSSLHAARTAEYRLDLLG